MNAPIKLPIDTHRLPPQSIEARATPLTAYLLYGALKAVWVKEHPEAAAEEYEQAIMQIAREAGI